MTQTSARHRIAALFLTLMLALTAHADPVAPTLVTPLQSAYTGSWYDPMSSGEGFDVWTFSDGEGNTQVFIAAFLGAPVSSAQNNNSLTPWFVSSGAFTDTTGTYPVLQATAVLGKGSIANSVPATVGSLTLTATNNACSALSAHLILVGPISLDKTYNLVPLVQPLASSCAAPPAPGDEATAATITAERVCIGAGCSNAVAMVESPALVDGGCVFSADIHYGGATYQGASAVAVNGSSTQDYVVGGARFTVEADDSFVGPAFLNNLERCGGSVRGPL